MCPITLFLTIIFNRVFLLTVNCKVLPELCSGVNISVTLSLKVLQPCPLCSCVCIQCAKSQSGPDLAVLPHIPKQYAGGPAPTDLVEHVFYF